MKSQRRHELQQNVLGQNLAGFVQFIKTNGNYIAWGALAVALIVMIAFYVVSHQRNKQFELQNSLDQAMSEVNDVNLTIEQRESQLSALANQDSNKYVAGQACLALGQQYSQQLARDAGVLTEPQRKQCAAKAAEYYRKVIAEHPEQAQVVALAHIGMARLAEDAGDLETARSEYNLAKSSSPAGYYAVRDASEALQSLDTLKYPVQMATTAPAAPPTPSTSQSATSAASQSRPAFESAPTSGKSPASNPSTTETAPAATR